MVTAPKVLVIDCGRVTNPDCEAGMEAVGAAMGVTAGAAEAGHKAAWAPARSDPAVTNYWARAFEAAGAEYTNERAAAAEAALAPALRTTFPATLRVVERAKKAGLTIDDIGLFELNEAFAIQVISLLDHFGIADDDPRVNPWGGAIALGHPLAASGVRLMIQLAAHFAERPDVRYGLTAMCVGLGQGGSVIWENPFFDGKKKRK